MNSDDENSSRGINCHRFTCPCQNCCSHPPLDSCALSHAASSIYIYLSIPPRKSLLVDPQYKRTSRERGALFDNSQTVIGISVIRRFHHSWKLHLRYTLISYQFSRDNPHIYIVLYVYIRTRIATSNFKFNFISSL